MKLFLSYPSGQRELAERLSLALEAEGHHVFMDRTDLAAGQPFHQPLREAIHGADAMVFLVTPASVAPGSYALAELNIARQRWRRPGGHVLPVMVTSTPMAALPSYLSAVTVLQPGGDLVAETVAAVAALKPPTSRHRWWPPALAVLTLLALTLAWLAARHQQQEAAAAQARLAAQERVLAEAASARDLCDSGAHAAAYGQLEALAAGTEPLPAVLDAREDCAMRWLREMRAAAGRSSFAEQVARAEPALVQGLARASGRRAADLRAHIGWGEYLRSREGEGGGDPAAHWQRALVDDERNVYANAMWANVLLHRGGGIEEALARFEQAEADGRDRPFLRALQFGGLLGGRIETAQHAVRVADRMRREGEAIAPHHRDALWNGALGSPMLHADMRAVVFAALDPPALLQTFDWLYPQQSVGSDRRALWRFVRATLLAHQGETAAARQDFASLAAELRDGRHGGRLLDEAERGLQALQGASR